MAEDVAEDTDSEPEEDALHVDGFDIVARHPGSIVGAGKIKAFQYRQQKIQPRLHCQSFL